MIAILSRIVTMVLVFFQQSADWTRNDGTTSSSYDGPIIGLLLARGGSRGIPNKNMAQFNDHPLMYWALDAMIKSEEIWVSTDDPKIKNYALQLGVKVHDRAPYTATNEASSIEAVKEFIHVHSGFQAIALVQCTSPLIQPEYLQQAAERLKTGKCDAVFSVTRAHQLRWSVTPVGSKNYASVPLNFDPQKRPRRQDWPGEFVENGMFYFSRRQLIESGVFQNQRSCIVEIPKHHSLEIDTIEDLRLAETMKILSTSMRDNAEL